MGNVPLYLANNIFKVEAGDKLKDSELFGINGFTVKITMIKSRSNRAGQEGWFVYDQVNGIDNILSNLLYTKNNKLLQGAGVGLFFKEEPNTKFRLSTFKDKYLKIKDFRIMFKKLIRDEYRKFIIKKDDEDDNVEQDSEPEVKKVIKKKKSSK